VRAGASAVPAASRSPVRAAATAEAPALTAGYRLAFTIGALDAAKSAGKKIATSQIALPKDICDQVYATSGYEQSVQTLQGVSLSSDMVFGEDDGERQIGTISGSVSNGLTVDLSVPVSAS